MKKAALVFAVLGCVLFMCAQNGYAHPTMTECITCHDLASLHAKAGHVTCTSCHVTPGDNSTTPSKCIVCHPAGSPGKCALVNKHGTNGSNANCATCHTDCKSTCPAAAVLGEQDSRLGQLRTFRDKVLAKSALGKKVISVYYNNSDAINAALENNPTLKAYSYKVLAGVLDIYK
jgi:hypothetical protein